MYNYRLGKRLLTAALAAVITVSGIAPCFSAYASDYADTLRSKGFTESYIDALVQLHQKYPNWEFEAFNTGLVWKTAIDGERSSHRNQIIDCSSEYGEKYYCSCSNCMPDGKYKYQYGNCVAASRWAVEYFMDPRNWLDEKHIFQFQSNAYSESDTQDGVEAILKPTWMYSANITYKDTEGNEQTYITKKGSNLKYSRGIMLAAKNSGLSAYYIASRIVKEVGASKPTAAGVCGTRKPFTGIYNYYSIGASSGAMSGLEFASGYLRTEEKTTLYSDYDSTAKKGTGTKTTIAAKQYMSYISTHGDYYKVRLYSQSAYAEGLTGYVLKSALRTTYFNYGRPWTNPYKSISGGAKYIAEKYLKYQYTTYLEKFNVNSESGTLYSHEYMQNINAVSTEAESTYKAYKNAGVLASKHIFYIPVFKNMPGDTSSGGGSETVSTVPTGLTLISRTTDSIAVKWNGVSGASKYYVHIKNLTKGSAFGKSVSASSATLNGLSAGNKYRIKVKAYSGGKWTSYSKTITRKAIPMQAKIKALSSPSKGKIYTSWGTVKGADGYRLKYARDKKFKKTVANKRFSASQLSYTGQNFTSGVTYYIKVRAYTVVNGKKYYGKWSKVKCIKSK